MCCVFSLLTTSQSAPSAWLRSTETKVTWRRKKRNPTEVRKEAQAINHCLCCETCWTPSYSSQWMEMRSRLTSLTAVWQRKRTTSGPIHPRLLRYQSSSRRSAAVTQCRVLCLCWLCWPRIGFSGSEGQIVTVAIPGVNNIQVSGVKHSQSFAVQTSERRVCSVTPQAEIWIQN